MSVGPKWSARWLEVAEKFASFSKDPKAKVGAVLVNGEKRMPGYGYNGLPESITDDPEILNNADDKNDTVVHAEINAILNCLAPTRGLTLFVTRHPCHVCAPIIAQAGIRQIHCYAAEGPVSDDRALSERKARRTFARAGIGVTMHIRD